MLSNFLKFVKKNQQDIILIIGVVLISLLSFAIGFITAKYPSKQPLQFEMTNDATITDESEQTATNVNMVAAAAEEMSATINEIAQNTEKA